MKSLKVRMDDRLYRQVEEICQAAGITREDLVGSLFKEAMKGAASKKAWGMSGSSPAAPRYLFPEMEEGWTPRIRQGGGNPRGDLSGERGASRDPLTSEAVLAYARELARTYECAGASAHPV